MIKVPSFKSFIIYALLLIIPASVQAADYLFAFLGGNARADLWMVDRSTGQVLLTETADAKTVAENAQHSGNIAFHHFADTDQNASWLADHLIRKALPELRRMEQKGLLEVTKMSFLYALAGLDAVDGQATGYDSVVGRQALHAFEQTIDAAFQSDSRTLDAIYGVSDSKLILQAINTISETFAHQKTDLMIYVDTYAIGFFMSGDGLRVQESVAEDSARTPAGGFFQLGKNGSQTLFDEESENHLTSAVQQFWEHQGQHYTDVELQQRYQDNNRNELGGVLAELGANASFWQLNESDMSILRELVLTTTQDISKVLSELSPANASQKKPVVITGFYADKLHATPTFYQALCSGLTDRYEPILINSDELDSALANAAVQTFNNVHATRYP